MLVSYDLASSFEASFVDNSFPARRFLLSRLGISNFGKLYTDIVLAVAFFVL